MMVAAVALLAAASSVPVKAQNPFEEYSGVQFTFPFGDQPFWEERRPRRQHRQRQRRYAPVHVPNPQIVDVQTKMTPGYIYISHKSRKLYFAESEYTATVYPIAVGTRGYGWKGVEKITRIQAWPSWRPPAEMRRRKPYLPAYVPGGPNNPLGAKALYLGDTLYRIHGTNEPASIGRYASSGCIRLHNRHILHLARKVKIGTVVVVR